MSDLNHLSSSPDSWVIFLLSASGGEEPIYPTQFHYIIGGKKGEVDYNDPNLTIKDTVKIQRFCFLPEYRKSGFGKLLLDFAEKDRGTVLLSCQRETMRQWGSSVLSCC